VRRCQGRTKSGRSRTRDIAVPSPTLPQGRWWQTAAIGLEENGGFALLIEVLFTQALGLVPPWQIERVTFDPKAGRIDFQVSFGASLPLTNNAAERLLRHWVIACRVSFGTRSEQEA